MTTPPTAVRVDSVSQSQPCGEASADAEVFAGLDEVRAAVWTAWATERPTDTKALYRWRIPARMICKLLLTPEWSEGLVSCGMGYADNEWWPISSRWDGYTRSVAPGLEWRLAREHETEIAWGGLDLLPNPWSGKPPTIKASLRWIAAPIYEVESFSITVFGATSYGWTDLTKLVAAWNLRAAPAGPESLGVPQDAKSNPSNSLVERVARIIDPMAWELEDVRPKASSWSVGHLHRLDASRAKAREIHALYQQEGVLSSQPGENSSANASLRPGLLGPDTEAVGFGVLKAKAAAFDHVVKLCGCEDDPFSAWETIDLWRSLAEGAAR